MKIGILLTDELRDMLQTDFGRYADMFVALLDGNGFAFSVYDVRAGEYPADIRDCDGYLVTGSRHGAYDDLAWLPPLREFINRLHRRKVALLGVCFGHQIVAQALGGEVEKSEKGWGLGPHEWKIHAHMPWMQPPQEALTLQCIHQDQVVKLPPGAQLLAGSAFCENAAFSIGSHVFCVQGHPEFQAVYVRALLEHLREKIDAPAINAAQEKVDGPVDRALCAQWIAQFFRQAQKSPQP